MTELAAVGTMTSQQAVHGSCGRLVPNCQLRVADLSTGESLGPGNTGELCIRGPQVRLIDVAISLLLKLLTQYANPW